MGMLGAFARGAGGAGLIDLSRTLERRGELSASSAQRDRDREDEQRFREEQARLEREARYGPGGLKRRRGAGGGDGSDEEADLASMTAGMLSEKYGMSLPQAQQAIEAYKTGNNPYTKAGPGAETIDDGDHMRNAATAARAAPVPNVEAYMRINSDIGRSFLIGAGGNPQQRASAYQTYTETDTAMRGGAGDVTAQRQSGLLNKQARYGAGGMDSFTGVPVAGSKDAQAIRTDRAQEGQHGAAAAKSAADANAQTALNGLYAWRIKALNDKTIDEPTRAAMIEAADRQIAVMKASGAVVDKTPLDTIETDVETADGTKTTKTKTKKTIRPGEKPPDVEPPPEALAILRADKGGKNDAQFDSHFGKGAAARHRATMPAAEPAKTKGGGMVAQPTTQRVPTATTGVEGLSPATLQRIALDPANPLQAAAAAALEKYNAESKKSRAGRVTEDPATDPALYQR